MTLRERPKFKFTALYMLVVMAIVITALAVIVITSWGLTGPSSAPTGTALYFD